MENNLMYRYVNRQIPKWHAKLLAKIYKAASRGESEVMVKFKKKYVHWLRERGFALTLHENNLVIHWKVLNETH